MFALASVRRAARAESDLQKVLAAFSDGQVMTLALRDDPYPYAVPVNYAPWVQDDELYLLFHGAKAGRKFNLLKNDGRAGFSILLRDQLHLTEDCTSSNFFRSLCGHGDTVLLHGEEALQALCRLMAHHGSTIPQPQQAQLLQPMLRATQVFALHVREAALKENRPH